MANPFSRLHPTYFLVLILKALSQSIHNMALNFAHKPLRLNDLAKSSQSTVSKGDIRKATSGPMTYVAFPSFDTHLRVFSTPTSAGCHPERSEANAEPCRMTPIRGGSGVTPAAGFSKERLPLARSRSFVARQSGLRGTGDWLQPIHSIFHVHYPSRRKCLLQNESNHNSQNDSHLRAPAHLIRPRASSPCTVMRN